MLVAEWRTAAVDWMANPPEAHATLERFQDSIAGAFDRYLDRMAFVEPKSLPSDVFGPEVREDQASPEDSTGRPKNRDQQVKATAARDARIRAELAKLRVVDPKVSYRAAAQQLSRTALCSGLSPGRVRKILFSKAD